MVVILAASQWLFGCGESPQAQREKSGKKIANELAADVALVKDVARAGPELENRLANSVTVRDGLMIVIARDPIASVGQVRSLFVLPATSPWVIRCGVGGLSVTFGTSVSGEGFGEASTIGNDAEVFLSIVPIIDQDACAVLAPRLGKRLKQMLEQAPAAPH
jgi:hypothetical protein